ncbi:NAD(+) diphosphatase [Marinomonas piezotolerans]|uniref:NAD(+) diphosphatase n=1 Tax=Marinomonas piezotolerans TaxID=2213058 RepID=A0A370U4M2_9GAMM|nr:NAD(+) diphosphatase [Marinomonas piezotolerans]RDL42730.1 NAD(+) diphosphatase [Marinomonas piezotolerans]
MIEIGTATHPLPHADAKYILLAKQKVLTLDGEFLLSLYDFHPSSDMRSVYCGTFEDQDIFVCRFSQAPKGFDESGLRELLFETSDYYYGLLSRAHQLATWDADHQYCGRCGEPLTTKHAKEHAKICAHCNIRHYPRISPCIIVSVRKDDQLLLARPLTAPEGRFSNIAGFVEAGETLEQAVHREVYEEVGIRVKNIRYIDSQPWSFPHQLMMGFFAEYESGELTPAPDEIAEAGWWRYDDLPNTPNATSISGQLILAHVKALAESNI